MVKALAFGARTVLIGRPYLWGLSVGGADGVTEVMRILRSEFLAAMALCGHTSLATLDRSVFWPGQ